VLFPPQGARVTVEDAPPPSVSLRSASTSPLGGGVCVVARLPALRPSRAESRGALGSLLRSPPSRGEYRGPKGRGEGGAFPTPKLSRSRLCLLQPQITHSSRSKRRRELPLLVLSCGRAFSSDGESASLTRKRSAVRVRQRPPRTVDRAGRRVLVAGGGIAQFSGSLWKVITVPSWDHSMISGSAPEKVTSIVPALMEARMTSSAIMSGDSSAVSSSAG
jgi:hypothetical protein